MSYLYNEDEKYFPALNALSKVTSYYFINITFTKQHMKRCQ